MSKKPLIIYHADCKDGFGAAWVAWRFFRSHGGADFYAGRYGLPAPDVTGRTVYLLDFCYKTDVMKQIVELADSVVVLDHHKTTQETVGVAFIGHPDFHFDMARSGIGMAWDYFFEGQKRPWLVNYVEDGDLWRNTLPNTEEYGAYIGTIPFDFETWEEEAFNGTRGVHDAGLAIIRKVNQYVAETAKTSFLVSVEGETVPIVCAQKTDISQLLNYMVSRTPHPKFAIGWRQRQDGWFEYSFRSVGDFDVGALAQRLGGGGHKNAAGFETPEPIHFGWRRVEVQ